MERLVAFNLRQQPLENCLVLDARRFMLMISEEYSMSERVKVRPSNCLEENDVNSPTLKYPKKAKQKAH